MATVQVLEEGPRNYVIKVTGAASDSAVNIVDVSALNPACEEVRIVKVIYDVAGAAALVTVLWDATTDVTALTVSEGSGQTMCFRKTGPLVNDGGAGVTGDVLISSNATTTAYTLVIHFQKVRVRIPYN